MEEAVRRNHNIIVEDRKKLTVAGVRQVLSFDEETVMLETELGKLAVKGTGLHITSFNTETSELVGEGRLHALIYTANEKNGGFLSNLFR